jgi:myo-inositol-hexaphosphate 3-phosphohydrolase
MLFNEFDIVIDVDGIDVVQCPLGEWGLGLTVGQPSEIIRAHLEGVWQCQAVVDRHQLERALSLVLVLDFLDQNVAFVSVKVHKS